MKGHISPERRGRLDDPDPSYVILMIVKRCRRCRVPGVSAGSGHRKAELDFEFDEVLGPRTDLEGIRTCRTA
jgi:hypothetical protein